MRSPLTASKIDRAGWHGQLRVSASATVAPGAFARTAGLRPEVMAVAIVHEHRLADVHDEVHGATTAAITAVGSPARHVGLATEAGGAVAALAGRDRQLDLVEEHARVTPD